MKIFILTFSFCLLSVLVYSQSGTIDYGLLAADNYNQTISGQNGITANVIYSVDAGGLLAPNDITTYRASTNGAEFTVGNCGGDRSNGQPATLEGLFVTHDYNTTVEALAGNYSITRFSEPICDVEFKLVDLTSPGISSTYPSAAQAVYNDQVIVTGVDDQGNTVVPTITLASRGVFRLTGGCNYFAGFGNEDIPFCDSDQAISGNTAFVNGGKTPRFSNCPEDQCFQGIYFNSMDVQVNFNGICLREVNIHYNNNNDRGTLHQYESNTGSTICDLVLVTQDQQPQAIMFEDYDYARVSRGTISGSVLSDIDNDGNGDNALVGVTITLFVDTDGDGILSAAELAAGPALIDSDNDGMPDNQATIQSDAITGTYAFNGVPEGNYIIVETDPTGYFSVKDEDSTVDATADDVANANTNDNAIPVTLLAGETDNGNDFIDQAGTISGTVSEDSDNDGNTTNMGDPEGLLNNVTITLYEDTNGDGVLSSDELSAGPAQIDSNGDGDFSEDAVTTTNISGVYTLMGIPPGNYIIVETDPDNYSSVYDGDDIADTGSTIDKVDALNNNSIPVSLDGGESDTGNNFVDELAGLISGTVYLDESDNGSVDKTSGVDAITVSLLNSDGSAALDPAGNPITTTTNSNGVYTFEDVPPGDYIVEIGTTPNVLTYENDDLNDGVDDGEVNDGSTTNGRIPVSIGVGTQENDTTNDFVTSQFLLPVELLSFTAKIKDDVNELLWSTSYELENKEFRILHSRDGITYRVLSIIHGNGTTKSINEYTYAHKNIVAGINYYRLVQIDFNGYETVVGSTFLRNTSKSFVKVYPNPAVNNVYIQGWESDMNVAVFNQTGKLVKASTHSNINIQDLPAGIYFVKVYSSQELIATEKLLKIK